MGTVAAGAIGGAGRACGAAIIGGGAEGDGEATTGTAEVVFREGPTGAGGSLTGAVADLGAGGGRGEDGNWIGAVARFGLIEGSPADTGLTGAVASRGWVVPVPGRARKVILTVSFLRGTAAVLEALGGGGIGWFSDSLMTDELASKMVEFPI